MFVTHDLNFCASVDIVGSLKHVKDKELQRAYTIFSFYIFMVLTIISAKSYHFLLSTFILRLWLVLLKFVVIQ